jgi:hypothetical protein
VIHEEETAATFSEQVVDVPADDDLAIALVDDLAPDTAVRPGDEPEGNELTGPVPDGVGHKLADDELSAINRVGINVIFKRVANMPACRGD